MSRHLHRDYHTAFCGVDASFELMTYAPKEADCAACKAAYDQHLGDVAAQQERDRQAAEEEERKQEEIMRAAATQRLARIEEEKRLASEQAQRDAEQLREWINPT